MRAFPFFKAVVLFTLASIVAFVVLLSHNSFSTHLQKSGINSDAYKNLWPWGIEPGLNGTGAGDTIEEDWGVVTANGGVRIVVFGDSWADGHLDDIELARGVSWPKVLCEELQCTSLLNYAVSQPPEDYPALPPSGALVSNDLYTNAALNNSVPPQIAVSGLPDLATQIQTYITSPPSGLLRKDTIFVISFGAWDVYHYSELDYPDAGILVDETITEIFDQLDILYAHYAPIVTEQNRSTNGSFFPHWTPTFQVIIPKLFDPSFVPGWLSDRPIPVAPSSFSEQQKNAVYLANRWNSQLEEQRGPWTENITVYENSSEGEESGEVSEAEVHIEKKFYYLDIPDFLMNAIVDWQLEDQGVNDSDGLGSNSASFVSVAQPCVEIPGSSYDLADVDPDGQLDLQGHSVCHDPAAFLFWDPFTLGILAKEHAGKEAARMIKEEDYWKSS